MEQIITLIHHYLKDEITSMNELMVDSLNVEEELVSVVSNYLASNGGKRMRPILTLLCAKLFGYEGKNHLKLAAAVEFIHMATLLHDDVVDGSKMRRFLPSANVIWGSKASILVGDFLFSQSFKLIVSTKLDKALEVLSSSSAIIAEGEVMQLAKLSENRFISEKEYIKIIKAKTAELFASSAEVGVIASGQSEEICAVVREFAMYLGIIFQITDDLLDYYSTSSKVGKNIGDDILEGKVTLPLILAFEKSNSLEKEQLYAILKKTDRNMDDFEYALGLLKKYDIKVDIHAQIAKIKSNAKVSLDSLKEKAIKIDKQVLQYLEELLEFAINRAY